MSNFFKNNKVFALIALLGLGVVMALVFSATSEPAKQALAPTQTIAPTTSASTQPLPATPTLAPTIQLDPGNLATPAVTYPIQANPTLAPTKTAVGYGPLPTTVPAGDPKAALYNPGPGQVLPKNSLVVGAATGLYLLNPLDNSEKLLAGKAGFSDPKVSPDGKHIAVFRQDAISRQTQLVLFDLGGGLKPVNLDSGVILAAAWSPDSKTLALTRATDTNNDGLADEFDLTTLVLYDVATGKQTNIGEGGFAAWSPDGVRLAYIMPGPTDSTLDPTTRQLRRGPNALAVYNFTNKGKRTLLESKGQSLGLDKASFTPIPPDIKLDLRYFKAVTWHPDSLHLTASADATGINGLRAGLILSLTLEDTTPRLVTAAGDAAGRVSWSPSGKDLAFETLPQYPVSPTSENRVALLNEAVLSTDAPVKTLLGAASDRSETHFPAWSPDSQQLAYLEGDNATLVLTDSTGKNPRRLLSGCQGFDWF